MKVLNENEKFKKEISSHSKSELQLPEKSVFRIQTFSFSKKWKIFYPFQEIELGYVFIPFLIPFIYYMPRLALYQHGNHLSKVFMHKLETKQIEKILILTGKQV